MTAGTTDTTPVFSPEGDRVAFERDDQIVDQGADRRGAERVLGAGRLPALGRRADRRRPALRSTSLRYRGGKIAVRVALHRRRGLPRDAADQEGHDDDRLALVPRRGGKSGTVTVKPSRRGARSLGSRRSQTVSVQLKPSTGATVTKSLKLRR